MAQQYSKKTKLKSLDVLKDRKPKHPLFYDSLQVAYHTIMEDLKRQYPLDVIVKPVYHGLRGFKFVVLKNSKLYEILRYTYDSLVFNFESLI